MQMSRSFACVISKGIVQLVNSYEVPQHNRPALGNALFGVFLRR